MTRDKTLISQGATANKDLMMWGTKVTDIFFFKNIFTKKALFIILQTWNKMALLMNSPYLNQESNCKLLPINNVFLTWPNQILLESLLEWSLLEYNILALFENN